MKRDIFEGPRLVVEISMEEPLSRTSYLKSYILYPQMGAIGMECSLRTPVTPNIFWTHRNRIRQKGNLESIGDVLQLARTVKPRLFCRTDSKAD